MVHGFKTGHGSRRGACFGPHRRAEPQFEADFVWHGYCLTKFSYPQKVCHALQAPASPDDCFRFARCADVASRVRRREGIGPPEVAGPGPVRGFYVGKAKGFYEQAGLDLTINPGGPNLNVETLVASGNDTFGLAGGTETVLFAREKGLPLVCIGVTVQKTPFTYVTYKDSGIKTVKDFAGKKVATWFTGTQYTLYSMLASAGVKQSDLTIVPQTGSMAAFVEKQFDVAAATYYNELNTLKAQGLGDKLTLIKPDDYGVVVQQDTVLVSEKYRNEKPSRFRPS
jgi:hypothetical protein